MSPTRSPTTCPRRRLRPAARAVVGASARRKARPKARARTKIRTRIAARTESRSSRRAARHPSRRPARPTRLPPPRRNVRARARTTLLADAPLRDRLPCRDRHGYLSVCLPGAPDHLRRRRERRSASPVRDHRRARRHVHSLAALCRLAARPDRPLAGFPARPVDRFPAALRRHAPDPAARQSDRAPAAALLATALRRPRRRLPARGEPGAPVRALRWARPRVHHNPDSESRGGQARRPGGCLRSRGSAADAAPRPRWSARGRADPGPELAEPRGPSGPRWRDGPFGIADCFRRRQEAPDQDRRLHAVAAEGRTKLLHTQTARPAMPGFDEAGVERA